MQNQNKVKLKTELFVLLPEYQDEGRVASAPYIKENTFKWTDSLPSAVESIMDIISFFCYEYADWYYDNDNVVGTFYAHDLCDYPSPRDTWNAFVQANGILDWRVELDNEGVNASYQGNPFRKDTLATANKRNSIDTDEHKIHAAVLATNDVIAGVDVVLKDEANNTLQVPIKKDYMQLYSWLCVNRLPQRRFDECDKHGENRKDRKTLNDGTVICPLLCSISRAQSLLEKAIGVGDRNGKLWYYDKEEKMFIVFENQRELFQPAFHGYHVSSCDKGFNDIDIEKLRSVCEEVPQRIK